MKKLFTLLILLCFSVITANAQRIFGAEYFIDGQDPGLGKAIALKGNFPADSLTISDSIQINGLNPGVHILYIRCVDSLGVWSHYTSFLFSVEFGITTHLTGAEMFVDKNDPGIGKAKDLNGSFPANSIKLTDSVSFSGLKLGVHSMTIRAFDKAMMSSSFETRVFPVIPDRNAKIVYAECFIDKDPGLGKGAVLSIANPSTNLKLYSEIKVPALADGKHFLYVRAKDNQGIWSHYTPREFNICETYGPEADFTISHGFSSDTVSPRFRYQYFDVYHNVSINYDSFYWKSDYWHGKSFQDKPIVYSSDRIIADGFTCLTVFNKCGESKICKKENVYGITGVSPNFFILNDYVKINIYGFGFKPSTMIMLEQFIDFNDIRHYSPDTVIFINENHIQLVFKRFDIFMNIKDMYGMPIAAFAYFNGIDGKFFAIYADNDAIYGKPELSFVVPEVIRPNNYYDVFMYYENKSTNYFGAGVPIIIRTPGYVEAILVTPVSDSGWVDSSAKKYIPWQRFYKGYTDTITKEDSFNIAMLILKELAPGEKGYIHFLIKSPVQGDIILKGNTLPPLYRANWLDTIGYRSNCKNIPPCLQCLLDILNMYGSLLPIMGCLINGIELGCLLGGFNPDAKALDYISGIFSLILSCGSPLLPSTSLLSALANAAGLAGNMNGMDDKNANCRQCFPYPPNRKPINVRGSMDPNYKSGPDGFKSENYINGKSAFHYTINFENVDTATAPAAEVIIRDKIDTSKLDISTLEFTNLRLAKNYIDIPIKLNTFTYEMDLRPKKNTILNVWGYFEDSTSTIVTRFTSLNPVTRALTQVVSDGFLDPNDINHSGEGAVTFRINPKDSLPHLTKIENKADIIFDYNKPIATPVWSNTIDAEAPVSSIAPLPPIVSDTIFAIKWDGTDPHSGIGFYNIYYSEDGGPYEFWRGKFSSDSAIFIGRNGHSYAFYSIAQDNVGNIEAPKTVPDAQTHVVVSVNDKEQKINLFGTYLYACPNPFSNSTNITYYLPSNTNIRLELIDLLGKNSETLINDFKLSGHHSFSLSSKGLIKGIYYIKLTTPTENIVQKIIIQ